MMIAQLGDALSDYQMRLLLVCGLSGPLLALLVGTLIHGRQFFAKRYEYALIYYVLTVPIVVIMFFVRNPSALERVSLFLVLLGYPWGFVLFLSAFSFQRSFDPGRCRSCGYDLRGQIEARCPECGETWLVAR